MLKASLKRAIPWALTATALCGGAMNLAHAQSADASLRGTAPADSIVTARNTTTGLTRSARAGTNGSYVLVGLTPGTYEVDAGAGTRQQVVLQVASSSTLDFTGSNAIETVVVTARRLTEVKTSEIATNISLHDIQTTPQTTRNFLEFADTVPGMYFQIDAKGNTSIHSGAMGNGATNVYIDGIGQKNYVRASGIAGQGGADPNQNTIGDPGNPFPQLAIGEYKVITSNYKAEYDQISGAAITAVTRSGTNQYEVEVFGNYTNASLRAATPVEQAAGQGKKGGPSYEYGFAVGGPILLDRLHYFLTYEGKQFTTPNSVHGQQVLDTNNQQVNYLAWMPAGLLANYGPVSNPFKEGLYFGKVDWEFNDADRIEASARYRHERQQAGASGQIAASAASTYVNDETRLQLSWSHNTGNLLNEAVIAWENTNDSPSKSSNLPGKQYVIDQTIANGQGFDVVLQTDGVDPRGYFITRQKGLLLQDDVTLANLPWHGDHTLKAGMKLKFVQLDDQDAATAPLYSYYLNAAGVELAPFQVVFGATSNNGLPTVSTSKNRQFGVYFQDDWAVNRHLLLNLGVRYDYEQTPTYTDFVTPQRFVDALFTAPYDLQVPDFNGRNISTTPGETYAQALAKGGINLSDYISNGHNRSNPKNEIQPRLGFSFDINGDQRHVVFGGAGRAYDRNVFGILQHETNKAALSVPTVQFFDASNPGCPADGSLAGPNCVAWNNSYLTAAGLQSIAPASSGEMHFMNNHLKAPYSDQFSLGMRNRYGDWLASVTLARINAHDGLIGFDGSRFGDGSWQWWDTSGNYNYAGWYGGAPNGVGYLYLFDNAKESRTTQLLVALNKAYTKESGWSANIAYTFSKAEDKLTFNGDYQFDYARPQLAPFVTSDRVSKHRLVVTGSIDAPWGITVGGKLVVETPKPYVGFDGCCAAAADGYNYQWLKISQFPRDTLGYKAFDLQFTKAFDMGASGTATVRLDALNLFNWHNYAILNDGWPDRPYYARPGDISGVPRTLKLTLAWKL
jgi:outer membrane receptor protein involved in Fe transport